MVQRQAELPDWLKNSPMANITQREAEDDMAERLESSTCPYKTCDGSGEVMSMLTDIPEQCKCKLDRIRQEKYAKLMKAGHMDLYSDMTFETIDRGYEHQAGALKDMAERPKDYGFYIYGAIGGGKTHLLACNVNREIEQGRPAALITVPQLIQEARESKGCISDLERLACEIPYLGLDDIGKEKLTGYRVGDVKDMLFRIIDARYLLYKSGRGITSFSSEWPRDEMPGTLSLVDKIDPAIVSRIREMTLGIFMDGPDLREGRM